MAPKEKDSRKKGKKNSANNSIINNSTLVEPHLRTAQQWVEMGKESLSLTANALNMDVKGHTTKEMAEALVARHKLLYQQQEQGDDIFHSENEAQALNSTTNGGEDIVADDEEEVDPQGNKVSGDEDDVVPSSGRNKKSVIRSTKKTNIKRKRNTFNTSNLKNELKNFIIQELKQVLPTASIGRNNATARSPSCVSQRIGVGAGSLGRSPDSFIGEDNGGISDASSSHAVRGEGSSLSGGTDSRGRYQSLSLPPLPKRALDRIKQGEYVNFDTLLPPSSLSGSTVSSLPMDDAGEYDISVRSVDGSPRISFSQAKGKGKIKDYNSWSLAWSIYLRCMVQFFPRLIHQLVSYQSYIAQFATQYMFSAIYTFDQLHRLNLANDPGRKWDVIDDFLFNAHLRNATLSLSSRSHTLSVIRCFSCNEIGHLASRCPKRAIRYSSGEPFRNGDQRSGRGYCIRYNRGAQCEGSECQYIHACSSCTRGGHPRIRCTQRPST